jgi:hypothetical protein
MVRRAPEPHSRTRTRAAEHPPLLIRRQVRSPTYEDGDGSVTTVLVLVILGLIWAAVLLPPYLQNRREHRPGDSIASFRHQLSVLERATPEGRARSVARVDSGMYDSPRYAPPLRTYAGARSARAALPMAVRRSEVRRRRRDVFLSLLAGVGVTFLLAVAMGGVAWMLHLLVDLAFVGFTAMLVKLQQESAEKDLKVRFLEPATLRSVPSVEQPLLRRVGS